MSDRWAGWPMAGFGLWWRILVISAVCVLVAVCLSAPASAAGSPVNSGSLVSRHGARGIVVLVPKSWTVTISDGGGSGSSSTWTNPKNKRMTITASTGVAIGAWFQIDGISGSITPLLPKSARVVRLSLTEFHYQLPTKDKGLEVRGAWIAEVQNGQPLDFLQIQVALPVKSRRISDRVIDDFVSRHPPLPDTPTTTMAATTTTTTRPAQSSGPTPAQIAQVLSQHRDPLSVTGTFEAQFFSARNTDGSGGSLIAVSGFDNSVNHPPCYVFFWHDSTYIGTDSSQPHVGSLCQITVAGPRQFVVSYVHYSPSDPLCCPSLSPVDITYTWNGQSLMASGTPPANP